MDRSGTVRRGEHASGQWSREDDVSPSAAAAVAIARPDLSRTSQVPAHEVAPMRGLLFGLLFSSVLWAMLLVVLVAL